MLISRYSSSGHEREPTFWLCSPRISERAARSLSRWRPIRSIARASRGPSEARCDSEHQTRPAKFTKQSVRPVPAPLVQGRLQPSTPGPPPGAAVLPQHRMDADNSPDRAGAQRHPPAPHLRQHSTPAGGGRTCRHAVDSRYRCVGVPRVGSLGHSKRLQPSTGSTQVELGYGTAQQSCLGLDLPRGAT